jgi:hypothetical protein
MFSRRVATFLLGVWIGCCLLADVFALQSRFVAEDIVASPDGQAHEVVTKAGPANATLLLQHLAAEQTRGMLDAWGIVQLFVGFVMMVLLIFTDQRKLGALAMVGAMILLTVLQHFFVTPDWIVVGREADFLPEAAAFSVKARLWTLTQTFGALELVKLLIGGALASYFFVMESGKRVRRKEGSRRDEDLLNVAAR